MFYSEVFGFSEGGSELATRKKELPTFANLIPTLYQPCTEARAKIVQAPLGRERWSLHAHGIRNYQIFTMMVVVLFGTPDICPAFCHNENGANVYREKFMDRVSEPYRNRNKLYYTRIFCRKQEENVANQLAKKIPLWSRENITAA